MFVLPFVLSFAAIPFAFAQADTSSPQLQIEAIEAHFQNAGLVPSLLSTFDPEAVLVATFQGVGAISPGQALTKDQVGPTPTLAVTPANSSITLNGTFTLAMIDAGPVGTDESQGQTRHWLVNSVSLSGSTPLNVSTTGGTAITEYAGPAPAAGSGAHRYVILLYVQPSTFKAPAGLDTANIGVSVFNFADYVQQSGLGPLVAATYLTVEEGTATFTPSSTAPVVTSTLPPVSSSKPASGSASGTASGTSGSATPSGTKKSGATSVQGLFSLETIFAIFAGIGILLN